MFLKLLKAPIALLRWLNIRLVIYLDNIFVMRRMLEEILMSRDTQRDFLLQDLFFFYKSEKISSETIPANGIFSSKNGYLWN